MKCLLIIFSFFIYSNLYSQNFEDIMKNDTIYILFEKSENQILYITLRFNKIDGRTYKFKGDGINYLSFRYAEYGDFDHLYEKSGMDVKTMKKRFLKKNMDKIIDISFITKYGFRKTYDAIYGKKKIYIIDKQEFLRKKIIAREVDMFDNYMTE